MSFQFLVDRFAFADLSEAATWYKLKTRKLKTTKLNL